MNNRLSPTEFAKQEGVNRRTVYRWIETGRITPGPDGKIDAQQGKNERQATESPEPRHQARKAQFDAANAALGDSGRQDTPSALSGMGINEKIGVALRQAQLKRLTAQAEQANLDLDKAAGALVERADIDFVLTDLGAVISGLLHGLADRYAPELTACKSDPIQIHKALEDIGAHVLTEINAHLQRKYEEHLP